VKFEWQLSHAISLGNPEWVLPASIAPLPASINGNPEILIPGRNCSPYIRLRSLASHHPQPQARTNYLPLTSHFPTNTSPHIFTMPSNTTANVKASKLTTKAYKDKPKAEVSNIIKKKEKCRAFYGRFDKPTTLWALALQTKYRKGKKSSHRGTPQRSQPADRAGLAAVWLPSHQGDHQPLYVFSLSHRITNPNNAGDSDGVPMQQGSIFLAAVGATGTC
jgi:hypothetical protein